MPSSTGLAPCTHRPPVRRPRLGGALLAGVLIGMAPGCGELGTESGGEPVVADSAGITVVTHPAAAADQEAPFTLSPDPDLRIGTLDGPEEERFSRIIAAVPLSDGAIAVLEGADREIRVFDAEGRFVRRIGRAGDGPGELRIPQALQRLPGDTLLAWDSGTGRLSWFDPEGNLIRDDRLATEGLGRISTAYAMDDGTVTLVVVDRARGPSGLPEDGIRRNQSVLVQWEKPDADLREWAEVLGAEMLISVESPSDGRMLISMGQPWYTAALLTAGAGDRVWRTDGTRWEVEAWDPSQGALETVVRLDRPLDPFDAAFIRELEAGELEAADDDRRDAVRRRHRSTEYPDSIPPLRGLVAGADGRLWLGLTRVPPVRLPGGAGAELREWLVLEADGSVVGRVSLPPRTQLVHADADYLLLVRFDELDLPYLERFPLQARPDGEVEE